MKASAAGTLDDLCARLQLDAGQRRSLDALVDALAHEPRAPTAIRDPLAVVERHIADSLVGVEVDELRTAGSIADIGSGAGLPGVPLATALPAARVSLVESLARKCAFLSELVRAEGLSNVEVVNSRVEQWVAGRGSQDAVLARAVASPAVVLEYAAPLLRIGGVLVDWRGKRDLAAEREGLRAADELGLALRAVLRVHPFPSAQQRHLHVYLKVSPTPERFPRRAGIARKRPLGGSRPARS